MNKVVELTQILTAASSAVQLMYVNIASSCGDNEKSANKFMNKVAGPPAKKLKKLRPVIYCQPLLTLYSAWVKN